jgi:hypothetical protein
MDNLMFWLLFVFAAITLYRMLSRRVVTPKSRVTAMLKHYHALKRTGLSEQDCLLQLLATRNDWKRLPHRFLAELVSRFRSKEDVMRFVSVSEDYRYHRDHRAGLISDKMFGPGCGDQEITEPLQKDVRGMPESRRRKIALR